MKIQFHTIQLQFCTFSNIFALFSNWKLCRKVRETGERERGRETYPERENACCVCFPSANVLKSWKIFLFSCNTHTHTQQQHRGAAAGEEGKGQRGREREREQLAWSNSWRCCCCPSPVVLELIRRMAAADGECPRRQRCISQIQMYLQL